MLHQCIESICLKHDMHPGHIDVLRHNAWELIFLIHGTVHADIAGKSYTVTAPSLIVISNYEPHVLTVRSETYERYVMTINPSVAKSEIRPSFLQTVFSVHPPEFCHIFPIVENEITDFQMLMQNLVAERHAESNTANGEQIWLSALLWKIYRMFPQAFSTANGSTEKIVASIRTDLENHPERKLNLNELAAAHFISPYYLSHVFHRITGYSIKRYLLLCRISTACTLLTEGNHTVAQVAATCGFSDVSNFSRYFREITGMTPWEYRKLGKS